MDYRGSAGADRVPFAPCALRLVIINARRAEEPGTAAM